MARSYKRTPYFGICSASTAKPYKRAANRSFRHRERADILTGREPHVSLMITADPRLMAYDGRRYRKGVSVRELRK